MPKWAEFWFRLVIASNITMAVVCLVTWSLTPSYYYTSPIVVASREAAQSVLPDGQHLTDDQRDRMDQIVRQRTEQSRKTAQSGLVLAAATGCLNVVGVYGLEIALTRRLARPAAD